MMGNIRAFVLLKHLPHWLTPAKLHFPQGVHKIIKQVPKIYI